MKRFILSILLMLVAGTSIAGDSGTYYNEQRNGEGILVQVNDGRYLFYVFTYGSIGCYESEHPQPKGINEECDLNGQRWFFGDGTYNPLDENVVGTLFMAHGINFPDGQDHDTNPFIHNVGSPVAVGKYELRRQSGGWLLSVARTGDVLSPDDPLYEDIFDFDKLLFGIDEGE